MDTNWTGLAHTRLQRNRKLLFLPGDRRPRAALCHAVGQACGTVHTAGHAMGYPVYELTAIVRALGLDEGRASVEARRQAYLVRLTQARAACEQDAGPWAHFLLR